VTGTTHTLQAPGLRAAFVPELAMVGCSLEHDGVELLELRDGLDAYRERGSTMGIPLLHPWANRLARPLPASELVHRDANGQPIHGVLPRALPFTVIEETPSRLEAQFDTHDHPAVLEVFRHPHSLTVEAVLDADGLEIRTTLRAQGRRPLPVSFGYHPYLRLPGVDRSDWEIELPVHERLRLDRLSIPSGEREPVRVPGGRLGARTFDDAFAVQEGSGPFVLAGGGRRIELSFEAGYRYTRVYAPNDDDVVAYEPMTAPANTLVAGGPDLRLVPPGESYRATFSITVADVAG
jgi:aldose 1-epimerase